jgi:hypothetical protein
MSVRLSKIFHDSCLHKPSKLRLCLERAGAANPSLVGFAKTLCRARLAPQAVFPEFFDRLFDLVGFQHARVFDLKESVSNSAASRIARALSGAWAMAGWGSCSPFVFAAQTGQQDDMGRHL